MRRHSPFNAFPAAAAALAAALLLSASAFTQEPYRLPPEEVVAILEAPSLPAVSICPNREHIVLVERETLPPIADLAAPMLRLAGWRINPGSNAMHRPREFIGLSLRPLDPDRAGEETTINLPTGAHVGFPAWAPDGSRLAFTLTWPDGVELWIADVESAQAHRVTDRALNATFFPDQSWRRPAFLWREDSRTLLCGFVPAGRGDPPERPAVPTGPVVQQSTARAAPVRTFQDLLQDAHDERLFDYYFKVQLAHVDSETGAREDIGEPAIFGRAVPSTNGEYLLVSRRVRPYSYLIGLWAFPEIVEIWDREGNRVREVARLPLRDDTPIQGVPVGPRAFTWQASTAATLFWAEALDGGDPRNQAPGGRDRVMALAAPFDGDPVEQLRTEHRFRRITWFQDPALAFVNEFDRDRRWTRTWQYNLDASEAEPRLVWDRSVRDRYNAPGSPVTRKSPSGTDLVMIHEGGIYLAGRGATPDGDRPFLDRLDLETLETRRLWVCEGENYESVIELLTDDGRTVLTRYESPVEPPNYYRVDLETGQRNRLTHFPDPAPQLRDVQQELVTYEREDGVQLSATLYLPPDYDGAEPLPLLIWAYPREFSDPGTAGQVAGSPYRFTTIGGTSHLFALTQGYAVLDRAAMPVIGDPETMNDTFVEQIVASAAAAIDFAVDRGVADRSRVAVGGHSYGAFMTANLLAHSDLFRAGIARSGAYNRTMTPFGFQAERRTLWEAADTYVQLSPFMHAAGITDPVLLIHGQIDNNPGTYPMQSERMFHAINGLGGTARLVMMPYEGHGFRARESVMHVLAEMLEWLHLHLDD